MAKETGHYKNVANGNTFNEKVETIQDIYKPSKQTLTLVNLRAHYLKANDQIEKVKEAKNTWSATVDRRQLGYRGVKKFATRIIGILSGTNMNAKSIETARVINNKLQRVQLIKPSGDEIEKDKDDPKAKKKRIISRQSYDSVYSNFSDLVSFLKGQKDYDPIIEEFFITNLEDYAKNLLKLTADMDKDKAHVSTARERRNIFLYTPEKGYVDTMLDAKNFIKGLLGTDSETYQTIHKINFRNIRK